MKNRIFIIDTFRGITALNIIFIHTVYWSGNGYIPDWVRNISLLLDVPMFFFLSGWAMAYTSPYKSIKSILENIKRWIFFLIILVV